jgi:hypothetical protein
MKWTVRLLVTALIVAPAMSASAQWYARGDFNGWGTSDPLTDQGGGYYTGTITGLTPGNRPEYKIALGDWSAEAPGSNGKVAVDANGEISFHFWDNQSWADGWLPDTQRRVGYDDPQQFGWELIGDMNGWSGAALTDVGNGLYRGTFFLAPGTYAYKFREQGSWDISIGDNFGNAAANNSVNVASANNWLFELDLPNGRFRAVEVPEPATLALAGMGLLGIATGLRRRRK